MDISSIVESEKQFFRTGVTRGTDFRIDMLKRLRKAVIENDGLISAALRADLNKQPFETYMCETGLLLEEIDYHIKHLKKWSRTRRVRSGVGQLPGKSYVCPEPYGVVLIMAPWNYPVQLCLMPLVGAVSSGNCAVVKPSAYAPESSRVIAKIIESAFPTGYVTAVEGGRDANKALLEEPFDYIFFTGSVAVGKTVMEAAAKRLTPVTLELGGKSPAIVCESANVRLACERIAKGKFINAGQTCVAPDYVLVHRSVHKEFIETMKEVISDFYGDTSSRPSGMTLIATGRHWERIKGLIPEEGDPTVRTVIGGGSDEATKYIAPTVLDGCTWDAAAMQEEIFGPVLPVIEYEDLDSEVIARVKAGEKPLALYLFTRSRAQKRKVLSEVSFGGGCVNETIMHLGNENMPFGGVGNSGMGAYHGLTGFETFSHMKSILFKSSWLNFDLLKPPYGRKLDLVRRIYK